MRTDYLDTVFFAAAAVLAIAIGAVMLKMRQIERDMNRLDDQCLNDEDMRLEDEPAPASSDGTPQPTHHTQP